MLLVLALSFLSLQYKLSNWMVRSAVRVSTQQTAVSANQIVDNQTRDSEIISCWYSKCR